MNEVQVSAICKALGDANRLKIVNKLAEGKRCGCDLLEDFDITQPTLSHHMKILCDCGLVVAEKEGRCINYKLCCKMLEKFKDYIYGLECSFKEECKSD